MSVIAIEGLIGAGKSTVLKCLEAHYARAPGRVRYEAEPLEAWTLLEQFYQDQTSEAFAFEAQVLCSYAHNKFKASGGDHLVFTERSAASALGVFVPLLERAGHLPVDQVAKLETLHGNLGLKRPDIFVYLDLDIDTCLERLAWRNRGNERSAVTRAYLEALKTAYNDFFNRLGEAPGTPRVVRIEVDPAHSPEIVARQIYDQTYGAY